MINCLRIAYAGTMPYYSELVTPSFLNRLQRIFFDYRNFSVNSPIGKMPNNFFEGLKGFHEEFPEKKIDVSLWGNIAPEIQDLAKSNSLEELVTVDGFITKEASHIKIEMADLVLLTVAVGVNGYRPFSIPGKVFDYLKLRKPILALVEPSHCKDLLEASGLAVCVNPQNSEQIKQTLNFLYENRSKLHELYKPNEELLNRLNYSELFKDYLNII